MERFTGSAREWWMNRKMAEEQAPNCRRACPDEALKVPGVREVAFRSLIVTQFSNPTECRACLGGIEAIEMGSEFRVSLASQNAFCITFTSCWNRQLDLSTSIFSCCIQYEYAERFATSAIIGDPLG